MKELKNWLMEEESGQGLVEYALIVGLVSIVVIGSMIAFGKKLDGFWDTVSASF